MKKILFMLLGDPQLYQYMIVGGIAAIVDITLFLWLNQYFDYHYLILATASFLIATLVNYLLCSWFVFRDPQARTVQMQVILTYLVSGLGLTIHHTCLFGAIEFFHLPLIISKILAMGVAFGWNFLSRKHLVFKSI